MRSNLVRHLVFVIAWSLEGHAQPVPMVLLHDGFEAPSIAGHALNVSGSFTFGAWSGWSPGGAGNAGFVRDGDDGLYPVDGVAAFAFNGGNPAAGGYIETTLQIPESLAAFATLTFSLGRGPVVGQLLHAKVEVFGVDGVHLLEELAIPEQVVGWTAFSFDFATGGAVGDLRIRFTDVSGPNQVSDLWLDAVSVYQTSVSPAGSAIPECTDWATWAGWAGLGVALRRRRKKAKAGLNTEGAESTEAEENRVRRTELRPQPSFAEPTAGTRACRFDRMGGDQSSLVCLHRGQAPRGGAPPAVGRTLRSVWPLCALWPLR